MANLVIAGIGAILSGLALLYIIWHYQLFKRTAQQTEEMHEAQKPNLELEFERLRVSRFRPIEEGGAEGQVSLGLVIRNKSTRNHTIESLQVYEVTTEGEVHELGGEPEMTFLGGEARVALPPKHYVVPGDDVVEVTYENRGRRFRECRGCYVFRAVVTDAAGKPWSVEGRTTAVKKAE